ncbi:hypothetical protein [Thauera mechernichensis]
MKRKHQRTLELIHARPVSANVRWGDIEALFRVSRGQVFRWLIPRWAMPEGFVSD